MTSSTLLADPQSNENIDVFYIKRKANCIGHIFRVKYRKKDAIEGQIERWGVEEEDSSYWITLKNEKLLGIERGSTISPCMENTILKMLWTCRKERLRNDDNAKP